MARASPQPRSSSDHTAASSFRFRRIPVRARASAPPRRSSSMASRNHRPGSPAPTPRQDSPRCTARRTASASCRRVGRARVSPPRVSRRPQREPFGVAEAGRVPVRRCKCLIQRIRIELPDSGARRQLPDRDRRRPSRRCDRFADRSWCWSPHSRTGCPDRRWRSCARHGRPLADHSRRPGSHRTEPTHPPAADIARSDVPHPRRDIHRRARSPCRPRRIRFLPTLSAWPS